MLKWRPSFSLVVERALSILVCADFGIFLRSPSTATFTLFSLSSLSSLATYLTSSPKMPPTSSCERFQFSVEKAYTVRYLIPSTSALFIISFIASIPALCPASLLTLFFCAHRPFPSIITATCRGRRSLSVMFLSINSVAALSAATPIDSLILLRFPFLC